MTYPPIEQLDPGLPAIYLGGVPFRIEAVAADYMTLLIPYFDAKYPGWATDERFMQRLREHFAALEGKP